MSETNIRTNLDIRANARQVDTLTKKFRELFSPKTTKEFNSEIGKVNRALEDQKRRIGDIAAAMAKVKQESAVYRQLEKDLKQATRQAGHLDRALTAVSRSAARGRGLGGPGGGGGAGGASGGSGMRLGGMQLAMPGQGALTAALGAVPFGGAIAAGSLMAATQAYGGFVQLQQARMQAAPYLASSASLMGYKRQQLTAAVPARAATGGGGTTAVGGELMAGMFEGGVPIGGAPGFMGELAAKDPFGLKQWAADRTRASAQGTLDRADDPNFKDKTRQWMFGVIADVVGAVAPAKMREAVARIPGGEMIPGKAATYTSAYDPKQYEQAGIQFGMAPQESIQQAGALGQAAGFVPTAGGFTTAIALQRIFGVGMQQQGGMMRALQHTGMGAEDTSQAVADMLVQGVTEGLNGSDLAQELQKQTGFLEEQSRKGVEINFERMRQQRGLLSGLRGANGEGIRSELIGDIERGFAGSAAQMGMGGGSEAMQSRMYRAYAEQQGISDEPVTAERWSQFMLDIQRPEIAGSLLPGMAGQFQNIGRGPAENQIYMQRMLREMGVNLGPGQALSAMTTGKFGDLTSGGADLAALQEAGHGVTPGTLRTEAGLASDRAGVGAQMAGTVQNFSRIQNDMARAASAFEAPLERVTGQMHEFADGLAKALDLFAQQGWAPTEIGP